MTRKSARLRRRGKRGRPRDESVPRTPSGRISRARRPREDPRAVAIEARRRVLGLGEDIAGHEKAATVLGRLWLAGMIDEPMRDAGERFLEIYADAMRALKAPTGLAVSGVSGSAGDQVSDDYVIWATRAVARYEVLKAALEDIGASQIVYAVVVEDRQLPAASLKILAAGLKVLKMKLGIGLQ